MGPDILRTVGLMLIAYLLGSIAVGSLVAPGDAPGLNRSTRVG